MNVSPYAITIMVDQTTQVQADCLRSAQEVGRAMAEEAGGILKCVEQIPDRALYNEDLRG